MLDGKVSGAYFPEVQDVQRTPSNITDICLYYILTKTFGFSRLYPNYTSCAMVEAMRLLVIANHFRKYMAVDILAF